MVDFAQHHQLLPGMRPSPEIALLDKKDGKETVKSENNATFVFVKKCENYELQVEGKAAKVMCQNCKFVKIQLGKSLVSGTFEILRSEDVFVKLTDLCEVPVFQIEDSNRIHIEISEKSQLKSIYFQSSNEIKVFLTGIWGQEFVIDTSLIAEKCNVDDVPQWIAHWNQNTSGMITEKVKRTGMYPQHEQREAKDGVVESNEASKN